MASSSSISEEAVPPWVELPRDITQAILQKLGAVEILTSAQMVCTTWWRVCQDPSTWRRIHIPYSGHDSVVPLDLERMCRKAVDLSQGHLTDITIERHCSDDLILYFSQRSGQLRRLQLVNSNVTSAGLSEAVKCLPLLEELLLHNHPIDVEAIANVGLYCPVLTSFKLNFEKCSSWDIEPDEQAFAVARNMPKLRHLQLIGNLITNEGLQAILDGCSHLESLDLRRCTNIRLVGDLQMSCLQRVKDLRLPEDHMRDYPFAKDPFSDPVNVDKLAEVMNGFLSTLFTNDDENVEEYVEDESDWYVYYESD